MDKKKTMGMKIIDNNINTNLPCIYLDFNPTKNNNNNNNNKNNNWCSRSALLISSSSETNVYKDDNNVNIHPIGDDNFLDILIQNIIVLYEENTTDKYDFNIVVDNKKNKHHSRIEIDDINERRTFGSYACEPGQIIRICRPPNGRHFYFKMDEYANQQLLIPPPKQLSSSPPLSTTNNIYTKLLSKDLYTPILTFDINLFAGYNYYDIGDSFIVKDDNDVGDQSDINDERMELVYDEETGQRLNHDRICFVSCMKLAIPRNYRICIYATKNADEFKKITENARKIIHHNDIQL